MATMTTMSSPELSSVTVNMADKIMKKMSTGRTLDEELHYVMSAIVGPIFCFVGMFGNILSIVTWSRPKMRSSTGRYLTGQAVADFAVLMFFILADSLVQWCPDVKYSFAYGIFFCYIGYPGLFLAVVCSVWFTVGVTCDRYIMVCWITKAKRYCSEKRANLGLFLITFNSFIINFPHYFSFVPVYPDNDKDGMANKSTSNIISDNNNNTGSVSQMEAEPIKRVETFKKSDFTNGPAGEFYEFWIHCMFLIIIPWVTVLVMNIMIIRAINKSNKRNADKKTEQSAKNCKDSENQITRLLLTVTFSFLFFIGLQCVIQCMFMRKPSGANMFLVSSSFAFAKCGIIFNSSLNFFLYCLTGRRFRQELLKVLHLKDSDSQLSSLVDRPSTGSSSRKTTSSTGTTGI